MNKNITEPLKDYVNGHQEPTPITALAPVEEINGIESMKEGINNLYDALKAQVPVWEYSQGTNIVGWFIIGVFIATGIYVSGHAMYDFINTYEPRMFFGVGAVPITFVMIFFTLCWGFLLSHHVKNQQQLLPSLVMTLLVVVTDVSIGMYELLSGLPIPGITGMLIFLLGLSLYGSSVVGVWYLTMTPRSIVRIIHIFKYGYSPDLSQSESAKLSAKGPQRAANLSATSAKDEVTIRLLQEGKFDHLIVAERQKETAVQSIAESLAVSKRELERRITELKRVGKL